MQKNFIYLLLIALSIGLASCEKETTEPEPLPVPNPWTSELVESIPGSDVGVINKTSYDSQGGLHMAYTVATGTNTSLRYAYKPLNGTWISTEVCPLLFYTEIDMAIDPSGVVYIAFEPDSDEAIHLAIKNQGGTFDDILVDVMGSDNHQGRYPALFADHNGIIHITFDRANHGLRYTTYTPGTGFTPVEILNDDYSGSLADLVVDTANNVSVVYQNGSDILFAYSEADSTNWQVNSIYNTGEGSQAYEGIDLVIDKRGNLHGAFRKGQSDNNVIYMELDSGSTNWAFQTLQISNGSNRTDRAIACDINNNPHILYDQYKELHMASLSIIWGYEYITGGSDSPCDSNYDIQIDENNRAHVSFHNKGTDALYYATKVIE
jgi:hypothetical protein